MNAEVYKRVLARLVPGETKMVGGIPCRRKARSLLCDGRWSPADGFYIGDATEYVGLEAAAKELARTVPR